MNIFHRSSSASHARPLVAVLGLLLVCSLVLTWTSSLDQAADRYLDEAIVDAGVAYAAARAINSLISVIQSIEISVSLGAGVAVNLGEALDPLNDLVERFSAMALFGFIGLGIQKLALVASASLYTKLVVSATMVGAWAAWFFRGEIPDLLKKFLFLMIFLRFAFAIEVGVSWVLDKAYFDVQQQEALSTLDVAENKLRAVQDEYMQTIEDQGVFRGAWTAAKNLLGADDQESITELTIGALIQLLVIMLVRSILLPVGFLWCLYVIFRRAVSA